MHSANESARTWRDTLDIDKWIAALVRIYDARGIELIVKYERKDKPDGKLSVAAGSVETCDRQEETDN